MIRRLRCAAPWKPWYGKNVLEAEDLRGGKVRIQGQQPLRQQAIQRVIEQNFPEIPEKRATEYVQRFELKFDVSNPIRPQHSLLTRPVLHAYETPAPMVKPVHGKTHRAYFWSYCTTEYDEFRSVVYDFADSRGSVHARDVLGAGSVQLACDDYSGYKALFDRGVIEIGCMAHAGRELHNLYANHRSDIAEEGLRYLATPSAYRPSPRRPTRRTSPAPTGAAP